MGYESHRHVMKIPILKNMGGTLVEHEIWVCQAGLEALESLCSGGAIDSALAAWPVGSVFLRNEQTEPSDILGGGTWSEISFAPANAKGIYVYERTA